MYDPEDLEDWAKDLIREGERHFERNLEEVGFTREQICIIIKDVTEFINEYDYADYDDADYDDDDDIDNDDD